MTTPTIARAGGAVLLALIGVGLALATLASIYGLAVEYGGGSLLGLVPGLAGVTGLSVGGAVALWGSGTRWSLGVGIAVFAVVVGAGVGADRWGERTRDQNRLEESRSFTCNGPNAEIAVDPRVDEVFADMPRPALIYGPVGGTRTGCTAGVSGGENSFTAYAEALRRPGWEVAVDEPDRFVADKDGIRITVDLMGAPDRMATVTVETRR